jgi:hypothetical protein
MGRSLATRGPLPVKGCTSVPCGLGTTTGQSYGAAQRELLPGEHCQPHELQNRAARTHLFVEDLSESLKYVFGTVCPTYRAAHARPIHVLCCLPAYSLYKSLIA